MTKNVIGILNKTVYELTAETIKPWFQKGRFCCRKRGFFPFRKKRTELPVPVPDKAFSVWCCHRWRMRQRRYGDPLSWDEKSGYRYHPRGVRWKENVPHRELLAKAAEGLFRSRKKHPHQGRKQCFRKRDRHRILFLQYFRSGFCWLCFRRKEVPQRKPQGQMPEVKEALYPEGLFPFPISKRFYRKRK